MIHSNVMFLWVDRWTEGVIEQNDSFRCGYCIQFGTQHSSRVALDYVSQWYYEVDPGTVYSNKRK